ncbi:MAG: Vgb family protein, partial [Alphaproteobacteria bacterium]
MAIVYAVLVALLVSPFAAASELSWNLETYPVPTQNALPSRITINANGTVWVLEANANKLGKFDPGKKAFTEYDIPTHRSFPSDLTTDSTGVVWFLEQDANQLG